MGATRMCQCNATKLSMGNIKLSDVKLPLGIINGVAESIAWW